MDELQLEGITKGYLGVQALKGVSFSVKRGSIHALAGQNGAGKSTLVKILSGAETPDGGTIRLGGEVVKFREPTDAQAAGIHTIYQELSLVPSLSVAENIFLGTLPKKGSVVDWAQMQAKAARSARPRRLRPRRAPAGLQLLGRRAAGRRARQGAAQGRARPAARRAHLHAPATGRRAPLHGAAPAGSRRA